MNDIVIAVISLLGTAIGSLSGVLASARLTAYRLQQLEDKVDKHNHFAQRVPLLEEQLKVANHRISDLEEESRHR